MEKKTIGSFLAVLRKANGMTQRDLGDMLGVSDKAVSRWERDACAPDLSLIPVIAEIFSVTTDELLRGERILSETNTTSQGDRKSEKQLQYLLNDTKTKFNVRSVISLAITFAGLLAAMICNFGFNRAYIGFFVSCVFYVAAIACESIFLIKAFASVRVTEMESDAVGSIRQKLIKTAGVLFTVIVVIFAATFPLIVCPWDTFMGILPVTWLLYGAGFCVPAAIICVVIYRIVVRAAISKEVFTLSEKESFADGTSFDDFDSFKQCMETEIPREGETDGISNTELLEDTDIPEDNGMFPVEIRNEKNEVVCSFYWRNETIATVSGEKNDDCLPITVYTTEELLRGHAIMADINFGFIVLYVAEIGLGFTLYFSKRKKIV